SLSDLSTRATSGREQALEVLGVLLTDLTCAELAPRGVEQALRLVRVVREHLLDRVVTRPDALRERTNRDVVHAEEHLVHDRLPIDGPVRGLTHGAIVGRRLRDIHREPERVARAW